MYGLIQIYWKDISQSYHLNDVVKCLLLENKLLKLFIKCIKRGMCAFFFVLASLRLRNIENIDASHPFCLQSSHML